MVAGGATAPQVPCTKYRRLVRIATEQPLAASRVCVAGHRGPHAWVGRLREARGEQQRGRSRLTVALVGAARQGRLARPRCARRPASSCCCGRVARSIDPYRPTADQIQERRRVRRRWRAVGGTGNAGAPGGAAQGPPRLGRTPAKTVAAPTGLHARPPPRRLCLCCGAKKRQRSQALAGPAGAGAGRRARRWRSRASGGARPSCSGPPRTPCTRHPAPPSRLR